MLKITFCFFAIISLSWTSSQAHAALPSSSFVDFGALESRDMRFISPSKCRVEFEKADFNKSYLSSNIVETLSRLGESSVPAGFMSWTPTGIPKRLEPIGCEPQDLEYDMLRARSSATKQSQVVAEYFKRCDSGLRQDSTTDLLALLGLTGASYDGCENPNIRRVLIRLPHGDILRGILAVKPDTTPRPLVILKCGLFCSGTELSNAMVFMHLYDESPFNVLVISNGASADFARDNGRISVGGFEEGQQLFEVIKMIRSGPLAKRTSSIHLMGISLGSHAGLYASFLSQINSSVGEIPVGSTLATCPVVDLKSSIHSLFEPSLRGKLAEQVLDGELAKVVDMVPALRNIMPAAAQGDLPDRIAQSCVDHLSTAKNFSAPFEKTVIRNTDAFWQVNNYLQLISQAPIKTPTLLLAADDDSVVPERLNTGVLMSALSYYRKNSPSLVANGNLAAVSIPAGNHCAFSITYGWRSMSAIYRGYVLSHSPEMLKRRKIRTINFPPDIYEKDGHLWPQEVHQLTSFKFQKGRASLQVIFHAFQGYNSECSEQGIPEAKLSCFRPATIEIPFTRLSARPSWAARAPLNNAEAQSLTRWANVHLKVLDAQGKPLVNTNNDGAQLTWETYDKD